MSPTRGRDLSAVVHLWSTKKWSFFIIDHVWPWEISMKNDQKIRPHVVESHTWSIFYRPHVGYVLHPRPRMAVGHARLTSVMAGALHVRLPTRGRYSAARLPPTRGRYRPCRAYTHMWPSLSFGQVFGQSVFCRNFALAACWYWGHA